MKRLILLFILICALLTACATTPYTGRSQLAMMNATEERQMGLQASQEILKESRVITQGSLAALVQTMGKQLVLAVDPAAGQFEWKFYLVQDDAVNAFSLGDGSVFFNTGILQMAQNSAQLAAVMGHEMGHVVAHHMAERQSQRQVSGVIGLLGSIAVGAATGSGQAASAFSDVYGTSAQVVALLPFSRSHELEADHIGLLIMADAGYDPRQSVEVWRNSLKNSGSQGSDMLSTHPMDETRIAQLEKYMPEAMLRYEAARAKGKKPDGGIRL